MPYLSRELQRKNNNGENSHLNFSLYPREICNTTVNLFREVLACTIKRITALAANKNNLISVASYERADFRGKLASASLKQSRSQHKRNRRPGFPRQTCLGLIEAERSVDLLARRTDFRGKLASASLKHRTRARDIRAAPHFRGKLASASLKLSARVPEMGPEYAISEANLPRPH